MTEKQCAIFHIPTSSQDDSIASREDALYFQSFLGNYQTYQDSEGHQGGFFQSVHISFVNRKAGRHQISISVVFVYILVELTFFSDI